MIRLFIDPLLGQDPWVEKALICHHCGEPIVFRQVVPAQCKNCKADQPYAEHLLKEVAGKKAQLVYYKEGDIKDANCFNFN